MTDTRYWLAFNLVQGIGPVKTRALLDHFGDLGAAWQASTADLVKAGLDRRSLENLISARSSLNLDREQEKLETSGARLLSWDDPDYPPRLKEIADPPPVLYVRGEVSPADEFSVSIVGTRRASAYGKEVARQLAAGLAQNHVTVISGLARGIDMAAHQAALDAGGRTIAVLGCGVDVVYPPEAARMAERIVEQGALVSDYPLGTRPDAANFPARNRIISGLSLGTIVVEAGLDSGALITAGFALDQGREMFAVPGSIYSQSSLGANRLIQRGEAQLITCFNDVLEELHLQQVTQQQQTREMLPQDETERALWAALSQEPAHIDELGRALELPISTLSSALMVMELKGLVRQVGNMSYIKTG